MAAQLYWCTAMLEEEGWTVSTATWPIDRTDSADPCATVEATVEQENSIDHPDLIVAKSLGTFAAARTVRHRIPGLWLTPVATDSRVLAALKALGPTSLVVAGTRDRYWIPGELRGAAVNSLEIEGADHSLETTRWRDSLKVQERVYDTIHKHLTNDAFKGR